MTDRTHPTDKENPMTAKDRHDELKALLSKISEESVTTSNVLADMLDLLRERLPESPNHTSGGPYTCMGCGTELYAGDPLDCGKHGEPAPADDLPGEPVEPSDLRAGDKVAFTWKGERTTGTLVSPDGQDLLSDVPCSNGNRPTVVWGGERFGGVSDVRLIERAPREDEDPDEALAKVLEAADERTATWLGMARAIRQHIEAEREDRERTVVDEWDDMLARAEKAERALDNATQRVLDLTAERDKWNTLAHEADRNAKRHHDRAEKAEAERDALRERLDALRGAVVTDPSILRMAASDIEAKGTGFGGLPRSLPATLRGLADALARDDERAAKGEQR